MKKEVKTFLDYIAALITGDDAEVRSIKIKRKAVANITAQIGIKKAAIITAEDKLETAEDNLTKCLANFGNPIEDGDKYLDNIFEYEAELDEKKEELEDIKDDIKFLEICLDKIQA